MATAEKLRSAINSQDIPIDIVPDYRAGGKNYGQELANNQPRGTYKYGAGPSTYSNIAPGTKTLGYRAQELNEAQFEEDKRATALAEQISLAKLAMQRANSGSAKEPTDKEKFSAIQSSALNYMNDLMQTQPTGVISGNDAGIFAGTGGQQMGYSGGMSPEKAAEETVKLVQEQLGDMGISRTDYENLVKMIYYSAGLEPPSSKTTATADKDDLAELEKLLGIVGNK